MTAGSVRMRVDLNGEDRTLVVEPRATLLHALREVFGLTGTRAGCQEGHCGTCTVLVDGEPVRSCLMFAVQAHRTRVETVEGCGDTDALGPLQQAFVDAGALGCGYCAPGFLMLAKGLIDRNDLGVDEIVETVLAANTCSCGNRDALASAITTARKAAAPVSPP
ncbi:MAG: 2Fe-2S iron-sulfur cluster-binding protein [Pseudomonadota bacterium]